MTGEAMSELTDDRLLPCPFCGAKAYLITNPRNPENESELIGPALVQCWDCDASQMSQDEDEAIAAWNRRAAASTRTEGAGVIEQCLKALEPMLDLQTSETAPAELDDEEADCWVRGHNSAIAEAIAAIRALNPPAPKVTTQERNA